MLIRPDSMSTWLYSRLDAFNRARTLAKEAPVTKA
jgi:hypothetical protein